MRHLKGMLLTACALTMLGLLLVARSASAQGSMTPSFDAGKLVLVGEGYRSGEQVGITVRAVGVSYPFTATADPRGRFRLDTGLLLPPLSSVQIEARDEQGQTQATITGVPGGLPGVPVGADEPPAIDEDTEPEGTDCPQ